MQLRVTSFEPALPGTPHYKEDEDRIPPLRENHTVVEVFTVSSPGVFQEKEETLKQSERIYSPILKCMQFVGIYFGETSLEKLSGVTPLGKRRISISFLYCIVIAASLWFNFVMTVTSICLEGTSVPSTFFTLLSVCFWSIVTAVSGTICLVVLPLREGKTSYFEAFIRILVESNINLGKVRSSSTKILTAAGVVWAFAALSEIVFILIFPWAAAGNNKPWNKWYGFKVISLVINPFFAGGAWIFSVVFVCITCLVLERLFDEFLERAVPNNLSGLDLGALRKAHGKLCDIVEHASKMLSPLLLANMAFFIPMICFEFYIAVYPPKQLSDQIRELTFVFGAVFWLIISAGTLAVILVFGSRVNAKASNKRQYISKSN